MNYTYIQTEITIKTEPLNKIVTLLNKVLVPYITNISPSTAHLTKIYSIKLFIKKKN